MDIMISEKTVGKLYVNIQIPLESFEGKSFAEVLDLVKGANGQDKQVFELGIGKFKVDSFRRIYNDDEKLCIEGAQLVAA